MIRIWEWEGLAKNISEEFVSITTFKTAIRERFLEVQRAVLEEVVQAADKVSLVCPECLLPLAVVDWQRERTVQSMFGQIRFSWSYGHCTRCNTHYFPADHRLGLHERATPSPRVQ